MEIIAQAKYIRTSPRKLRLVVEKIKNLSLKRALLILGQLGKKASLPLGKTLKSAQANALANSGLKAEDLKIKKIEINEGPAYKRFRAGSRGRVLPFKRRTSHITVVLEGETQ